MTFKCCALVPSYNHCEFVEELARRLRELGLAVIIIDDGSEDAARVTLAALHDPEHHVFVYRLNTNHGKGGAVMHGFELARAAGFTHALQLDADGQHDLSALPHFLTLGETHPNALIAGQPLYDESMPRSRRVARRLTHFWVGIETLMMNPPDSMCGLRLYPLEEVFKLRAMHRLGRRMEFDIEIFVRLIWEHVAVIAVPVRVFYPEGNVSNFGLFRDNWLISLLHTRLVLELPFHMKALLSRGQSESTHWSSVTERGTYLGLSLLAFLYRVTGRYGCLAALLPIALYFNLTGTDERRASRDFLSRAYRAMGVEYDPGWFETFRHSFGFARKTVDTFAAWLGCIDPSAIDTADKREPDRVAQSGQGILLIVSHLGNIDISRALLNEPQRSRIKVLVHTVHAENFARVLRRFKPNAMSETIQVTDLNPAIMITLREAIERGDWVAVAGDRTPVRGDNRISMAPFLGSDAAFPQGPYILAHLLECPVYLMFCLRQDGIYRLYFELFAERIHLPRRDRQAALGMWVARYARRLESFCLIDPFQWYNFFDFWQTPPTPGKAPLP
jgi:predicted LPLAT superfamily acyltransferase